MEDDDPDHAQGAVGTRDNEPSRGLRHRPRLVLTTEVLAFITAVLLVVYAVLQLIHH